MKWLNKNASDLSKQKHLNKNQLQELLLGIGLYLRDHELACFTEFEETPVPKVLAKRKMVAEDINTMNRVI